MTSNCMLVIKFGHTEVKISVSRAKNCEASAGGVRFGVEPRKPEKNAEKQLKKSETKNFCAEK